MSYKYNPLLINVPPAQYIIVKQIELTQDSIEQIADAVVRKLKDVSVTNVGNIPTVAEEGE